MSKIIKLYTLNVCSISHVNYVLGSQVSKSGKLGILKLSLECQFPQLLHMQQALSILINVWLMFLLPYSFKFGETLKNQISIPAFPQGKFEENLCCQLFIPSLHSFFSLCLCISWALHKCWYSGCGARSTHPLFTILDLLFVDQLLLVHMLFKSYFSTMIIELYWVVSMIFRIILEMKITRGINEKYDLPGNLTLLGKGNIWMFNMDEIWCHTWNWILSKPYYF